jgi:hypothetical protein
MDVDVAAEHAANARARRTASLFIPNGMHAGLRMPRVIPACETFRVIEG